MLQDNVEDLNFPQALVFRLGGEYQERSLAEFAWKMGLYEAHETMTPTFSAFLWGAEREYFGSMSGYEF